MLGVGEGLLDRGSGDTGGRGDKSLGVSMFRWMYERVWLGLAFLGRLGLDIDCSFIDQKSNEISLVAGGRSTTLLLTPF